jgi:glycosyltransferase involved in cell wall biosynthesis
VKLRKRFLLVQHACIEGYPPVLHQAGLLSAIGDVTIIDTISASESHAVETGEQVKRIRIKSPQSSPVIPQMGRLWNLRKFSLAVREQMLTEPAAVIGFEPQAASAMLRVKHKTTLTKRIVHLHELPTADGYAASFTASRALQYLIRKLSSADAVVVPDQHRAEYVQSIAQLKRDPLVVMNCPRLLPNYPSSLLIPLLRARGITTANIVHYQGVVGADHNIETVIRSMRFWPADAVFVVVGGGPEAYLKELNRVAIAEGVAQRLVLTGRVPYSQLFQYAMGASVGVTLLDSAIPNWKFSAGASNKRFEYAALGIPQVTNAGPGIENLFGNPGIAAIADHRDAEDIGRKIARFLADESFAREAGAKARALHLQSYNYERQFQKVLEFLG